jgi:hypothetical protein
MSKLMRSILAPVEHGCVYIRDAESKEAHETWDPDASPVVWGTDFILFAVQPAVDGEVELEIWRGMPGEPLSAVLFDGVIYGRVRRGGV